MVISSSCSVTKIWRICQALASCLYFQPFLQKVIEECELSMDEEQVANLPLTAALAALLEGKFKILCII